MNVIDAETRQTECTVMMEPVDLAIPGMQISEIEQRFCAYTGARSAIVVESSRMALSISLEAIGVHPGDEVILSPLGSPDVPDTLARLGAVPIFVDVDTDYNINPDEIERHIARRTRAIIPTHCMGQPCRMDKILACARKSGLYVIEDATEALGATYRNHRVGAIGDATVFGTRRQRVGGAVPAGMITTDNRELAEKLYALRTRDPIIGGPDKPKGPSRANASWMDAPCPDRPLPELIRLDRALESRRRYARMYSDAFRKVPGLSIPFVWADVEHAWYRYALQLQQDRLAADRDALLEALQSEHVEARAHPLPVHLQPIARVRSGFRQGDFPVAERLSYSTIMLPLDERMAEGEVKAVIAAVRREVNRYRL